MKKEDVETMQRHHANHHLHDDRRAVEYKFMRDVLTMQSMVIGLLSEMLGKSIETIEEMD